MYVGPSKYCEYCDELVRPEDLIAIMTGIENPDTETMVSVHKGNCKTEMLKIYGGN